jgi:DNA-directed RNA polymerase subunit M/transcription elongation factor TFIIS
MAVDDKTIRNKHITILSKILSSDKKFKKSKLDALEISVAIERGCNNAAIKEANKKYVSPVNWVNDDFKFIYSAIFYKIVENIDPKSSVCSRYIIDKIINKDIELKKIALMDSTELCPEKNEMLLKEKRLRISKKIKHKTTKRFPCPNCKERRAKSQQVQLRSFDEGYNTSLTCINCGHKWII